MRRDPSNRESSRAASRGAIIVAALLAATLVIFLVLRSRGKPVSGVAKGSPREEQSTYQSRSVLPAPTGARGEKAAAAKPKISGNVYSMTTGELLPGATVVATTFQVAGNIMSPVGSAKSDEHGHFALTLPEGSYQLNASADGYGPGSVAARSGETVSVMLPESGVVEGHVRDESGKPVQRFSIDVIVAVPGDAPASPPIVSKTFESADGSYRISEFPIWEVILRATAEGYAPAFSEQMTVPAKAHGEVDLTLSRGCELSGTVKDKSGTALPRVFVDAESQLAAGEMSNVAMHAAAQAQSDDNGAFHLTSVPKGTVIVRGYDGSNAVTTVTVEVPSCDKLAAVDLVMSPGGSVTGIAREGDGAPIAGAKLSLISRAVGYINVVSDKQGRYTFEDVPAGPARIELNYEGRSTIAIAKVEEGKETEQDITLFSAGKGEIRGRITAGGRPLAGAKLMIASTHQPRYDIGLYAPVTDEDGNYRVPALAPGAYLVTVNSVPRGRPVQIKGDETATVDLDVTPKPPRTPKAPPERN